MEFVCKLHNRCDKTTVYATYFLGLFFVWFAKTLLKPGSRDSMGNCQVKGRGADPKLGD